MVNTLESRRESILSCCTCCTKESGILKGADGALGLLVVEKLYGKGKPTGGYIIPYDVLGKFFGKPKKNE